MSTYTGEIASTLCAVLWALALVLFAGAGRVIRPMALNLLKNSVATPLMAMTMLVIGAPLVPTFDAWTFWLLAVSGILGIAVGDTLLFASLNRLGPGWTAVVSCTYSPLMILVTAIGFGVPVTLTILLGATLIATGVLVLGGRFEDPRPRRDRLVGLALGIAANLIMVLGVAVLKYPVLGHPAIFDSVSALEVSFWRMLWGGVFLLAWLYWRRGGRFVTATLRPNPAWRWMIPGALIGSYGAMIVWILGMKEITGSLARAAVLNQTTTIFLPAFAALLLREPMTRRKSLAVMIAFAGATVVVLGR